MFWELRVNGKGCFDCGFGDGGMAGSGLGFELVRVKKGDLFVGR